MYSAKAAQRTESQWDDVYNGEKERHSKEWLTGLWVLRGSKTRGQQAKSPGQLTCTFSLNRSFETQEKPDVSAHTVSQAEVSPTQLFVLSDLQWVG